jgi:TatD DNase family protein
LEAALEMGAYIGVAGNVTYKNADHIRSLVKTAPPDRILLETDAPFLPPHPHRGQVCQPWMIELTASYLQDELNLDLAAIYQTSCRLFTEA